MPTTSQDRAFAQELDGLEFTVSVPTAALDYAVDWIGRNLEPEDIFSEKQLSNWAEANGYIKE